MLTRLRVDLAGYEPRVSRSVIFDYSVDKGMFLQIINELATIDKVILHVSMPIFMDTLELM